MPLLARSISLSLCRPSSLCACDHVYMRVTSLELVLCMQTETHARVDAPKTVTLPKPPRSIGSVGRNMQFLPTLPTLLGRSTSEKAKCFLHPEEFRQRPKQTLCWRDTPQSDEPWAGKQDTPRRATLTAGLKAKPSVWPTRQRAAKAAIFKAEAGMDVARSRSKMKAEIPTPNYFIRECKIPGVESDPLHHHRHRNEDFALPAAVEA